MQYRQLGNSDLKLSVIGLGGNNFGERIDQRQSIAVIEHALDLGINHIDTADSYGNGLSETFVGEAIKKNRSKVIVATKFGSPRTVKPGEKPGSREFISNAVNQSLKRLNTDYIDIYYLHKPDPETPIEETLRSLDAIVREGKVRYLACSNFSAWQLCDAQWTAKYNGFSPFIVTQMGYNLLDRSIESDLAPCCRKFNVGFIPYMPLAGGFLTGKYPRGATPGSETRFANWKFAASQFLNENNYAKLEKFAAFAQQNNHDVTQLAIAWLLAHPWLSAVTTGATTPEQVELNVAAAEWQMTESQMEQIQSYL